LEFGNLKNQKSISLRLKKLGKILAKRNHTLIASPSSGVQGLVAKYYKEFGGREFIGYYPDLEEMKRVGEEVLIKPDVSIMTNCKLLYNKCNANRRMYRRNNCNNRRRRNIC
jgi:hypothetical protein